jgi:hypothetical protein
LPPAKQEIAITQGEAPEMIEQWKLHVGYVTDDLLPEEEN